MSRYAPTGALWRVWRKVRTEAPPVPTPVYCHDLPVPPAAGRGDRVTVLIPTLERYPYLRTLLGQLREQTIRPHEIIVVDQTPREARDTGLADEFCDLPLRILYLDQAGQCSSRNAGLRQASGDYVLFLDDDDEVPPDLLERDTCNGWRPSGRTSRRAWRRRRAPGRCRTTSATRASDVFPTNNAMIRREVLRDSGLFDLAYDRGQRATATWGCASTCPAS